MSAYPFVQAAHDYGTRRGPALAFVIHMAEGGGTVGFLDRNGTPPPRGVSVHYVIERSGRVVQMLPESHISGSIDPNDLRTTDGPIPFGARAGRAVMGTWWRDPNQAVISCEIEGFASAGPNVAQAAALVRLVTDIRSRHPSIGLLGHRDFTGRKACPGPHIDWTALGGHGPFASLWGVEVPATIRALDPSGRRVAAAIRQTGAPFGTVINMVDLATAIKRAGGNDWGRVDPVDVQWLLRWAG